MSFMPIGGLLQINQRGLPPGGGGAVYFSCPIVKRMKPLLLNDSGKVKRVRGISYLLSIKFPFCNQYIVRSSARFYESIVERSFTVA